ncbi:MAG: sodium:glutamate symporter, partial [Yaniella sp.]|nr:sodium:glutamate symporter [Yaniella sp.]
MLGGVIIQLVAAQTGLGNMIARGTMERIQGLALDTLIIAALATLSLDAIANNIGPFVILAVAGVLWNVFVLFFLAPRYIQSFWFERGIADFGQSMGVTATGLLLLRMADPHQKSPAYEAFGYKQLVFEPFFGGGLVTAASIPLIVQLGPYPLLIIMIVLLIASLLSGLFYFGKRATFTVGQSS